MGYRASITCTTEVQAIVDYHLTPANCFDGDALPPLLWSMEATGTLACLATLYGDNAYASDANRQWVAYFEKIESFHTKEETGKNPERPRSARRKSRIRSKVESIFGILAENYAFGRAHVRG